MTTRNAIDRVDPRLTSTILMVDDEPTTLEMTQLFLEGEGYERFVAVQDSRLAVRQALEHRPDLVLLDLMMPHVGGLEILAEMRAHPQLRHLPVVILTSSTDSATKLAALEQGATDFLAKPVDPSELALRLRNLLTAKAYQDRLAYYDDLTGLPNRRRFVERLTDLVENGRESPRDCCILHLGLGRLRPIDEAFGRGAADEIVTIVAERLRTLLEKVPLGEKAYGAEMLLAARVAHDEFLVAVEGAGRSHRAIRIARQLLAAVQEPCRVASTDLTVTGHLGISLFPDDGGDAETLLGHARIALSRARDRGDDGGFQFHDESLNTESRERLHLELELRDALVHGGLRMHYQPKVDVETGRIRSAEALARWTSATLGPIAPERFVPIAEESDLILELGEWTVRSACRQLREWRDAGLPSVGVSVNVSSRQFRNSDIAHTVASALAENRLEGHCLTLELTESSIMENPAEATRILAGLKKLGVTISVDDFGTGYSSLGTLKHFPIDELKIDRSFVKGVPDDADDCALLTAAIAMGHALGLRVVGEGVETEAQLDFLRERGCDEYQGFLCSQAVSPEEWPRLLDRLGD